jgi:flagellar motor component MotA
MLLSYNNLDRPSRDKNMSENDRLTSQREALQTRLEVERQRIVERHERQIEGIKGRMDSEIRSLERRHEAQLVQMEKAAKLMPATPSTTH